MIVHPDIAKLRGDPASQHRVKSAMATAAETWRLNDKADEIAACLKEFADGAPLDRCAGLSQLMTHRASAAEFVGAFATNMLGELRRNPLGEIPFRHGSSEGYSRLQLLEKGGASLSLVAYEPIAVVSEPETAQFADVELYEIALSGSARVLRHALFEKASGGPAIQTEEQVIGAGDRISCRSSIEARQVAEVSRSLCLLQLSRVPVRSGPSRVYRLCDATILHQAAGDKRTSEQVMALAVLGALGQSDNIPVMEDFALRCENDRDARWEAVRQTLALDAPCGFDLLRRIGADKEDDLSGPAEALRTSLLKAHPELSNMMMEAV